MRKFSVVLLSMAMAVVSWACAYQRAFVSYADYDEVKISAEGWEGRRLGRVTARERGPIWANCTKLAEGTVWVLMEEAKKIGGNAVGEIRWLPDKPERTTTEPVCQQKYGWFLVWPTLATPLFQRASVEGEAYLIEDESVLPAGAYVIPDDLEERWRLAAVISKTVD